MKVRDAGASEMNDGADHHSRDTSPQPGSHPS